jgi:hypothetical protein
VRELSSSSSTAPASGSSISSFTQSLLISAHRSLSSEGPPAYFDVSSGYEQTIIDSNHFQAQPFDLHSAAVELAPSGSTWRISVIRVLRRTWTTSGVVGRVWRNARRTDYAVKPERILAGLHDVSISFITQFSSIMQYSST